jgi:hypothetical protein
MGEGVWSFGGGTYDIGGVSRWLLLGTSELRHMKREAGRELGIVVKTEPRRLWNMPLIETEYVVKRISKWR